MKYILIGLTAVALLATAYFSKDLYDVVHERKAKMEDYAEINMVNYELFNMQLWKDKTLEIIDGEIKAFSFSEETYEVLDDQIQNYARVIHKTYIEEGELTGIILSELKANGTVNKLFMTIIEQQLPDIIKSLNLKPQIPALADQIVGEIRANEELIKGYLQQELLRLVLDEETGRYLDRREVIYSKYNQPDLATTDQYLLTDVQRLDGEISSAIMIVCLGMLAVIILALLMWKMIGFNYMIGFLTLGSIMLLVLGVTMPMIDIDARINSFIFELFGAPIEFDEQVIYYQSKSIVEVTKTLWQGGTWDLKLVGTLVLLFSIVFPFFKLLLSGLYILTDRVRSSGFAKGVIFHLGKWSMADVFVVAIFMAYIGFYGIISTQLNGIERNQGGWAIETVNYSRLSPGAFFFTAYTVLSIFISVMINRHDKKKTVEVA